MNASGHGRSQSAAATTRRPSAPSAIRARTLAILGIATLAFASTLTTRIADARAATADSRTLPAAGYDPLRAPDATRLAPLDLEFVDARRNRTIPLRVWLPPDRRPAPVIVFSHGLGGARDGYAFVGRHWAARGYVVVHPQHAGSDDRVWKQAAPAQRYAALRDAANLENFRARVDDVGAVLDVLERWNAQDGHPLHGRLDLAHVGMSGHSFGAITTQAVSGEAFPLAGTRFTDPRIRAALPMSPSVPRRGAAADAFGAVTIPWLAMTGTRDVADVGGVTLDSRRAVYPALPAGGKYELVLDGAEHSAFSDRALSTDVAPRNPAHHRAILAISTAFWDAWLRDDAAARAWLDGDGPRTVLAPADLWQRK